MTKKPRVLVAMSGGVDSSVAAFLLKDQGYDVVGVTMQVWDYSKDECSIIEGQGTCCSSLDVDDARAVCDQLEIPFYVLNCEAKFKKAVIDDFVDSYLNGRTPIPCVNCNTYLKFDHLYQKMQELECDFLATGHYARIEHRADGRSLIVNSDDRLKDQTYFLFTLKPEILPKLLFPVGELEKPRVREIAEELGLGVARKKDSTGICFVKGSYAEFVESQIEPSQKRPGVLKLFPTGEILGDHPGIHNFTCGQRKGLGISSTRPLYVVKIEAESGTVWLGDEEHLYGSEMLVTDVKWFDQISEQESLRVKIRFQHMGGEAKVSPAGEGSWRVRFLEPQRSITPGQAAVFYRENQLLGGGWIQ